MRRSHSPLAWAISIRGLAPLISKPGGTFTPRPHPLLPLLLPLNSGSLTNPSFQEREADLFWGRASRAVCVGTAGPVILPRQWHRRAKGESSPCSIALLNPLLWLAPSQPRKGTKLPGRLWQAVPLTAGQKLIPSSSPHPVPPTPGQAWRGLALCVRLSGGVRGENRRAEGGPSPKQLCLQTDAQTDVPL